MPHTPPLAAAHRIDPRHADPDHPAVRDWTAHIAAGRVGTLPTADPTLAAVHAANAALIARRRREARA